jgi:glycosyltransferase involved in cell wall biosynthesis
MVAQDHDLKGLPTMLEAAGRLIQQGQDLWIAVVGGMPIDAHIRQMRKLRISSRVNYIGWTDPLPFYQAADVYVHPSHYDACSLGVLEALATGLPVITSAANGASELFEVGDAGFVLADAEDVTQLRRHLVTLSDDQVRRRMGQRARQVAEQNSLAKNFERIEQIYREIVEGRGTSMDRVAHPPLRKSA